MTKTESFNRYHKSSNYLTPKDEKSKKERLEILRKSNCKKVMCLETKEIFKSVIELEKSLATTTNLSSYVKNEKPYKGLNYKYV